MIEINLNREVALDMMDFNVVCDFNALVFAEEHIIIHAKRDEIMAVLSDINNWYNWRNGISEIKLLASHIQEGAKFEWKSGGLKYKSEIHTASAACFGWTGNTIGAHAIHNWYIKKLSNGSSEVVVQESLSGWSILLLRKMMRRELPILLKKDLQELKFACENKL